MESTYSFQLEKQTKVGLSAFTVAQTSSFEVIESSWDSATAVDSPSPRAHSDATKPRIAEIKAPRIKRHWNTQEKRIAVSKAKEMGLTKATRYLQANCPGLFAELSASTLQYWMRKALK